MTKFHQRVVLLASVPVSCLVGLGPAQAQSSGSPALEAQSTEAAPTGSDQSRNQIGASEPVQASSAVEEEEIVVTAQKREQSINNVGLSITAITGDALASRGVTDPSQLTKLVPGFNFNQTGDQSPVYTIRGVGYQDSSIAASPTVTVYVDEVPIPYSNATLGAALDIERVEVLKGPQGTLYGGNSTGGAINYIAAKPSDQFGAGVNWDFGRFATSDLRGYVTGPVTDTLSVRLSGRWLYGGSSQYSYTRDDGMGRQDQLYGRLLASWRPTEKLSVDLNVNAWRDHSESQAGQLIAKQPAFPIPLDPAYLAYPAPPEDARAADWDPQRSYRHDSRFFQGTVRLNYQATDDLVLTSISSFQDYKRYTPTDLDGTSLTVIHQISNGTVETFYQELRAGFTLPGDGNVTVGANYQSDRIEELNHFFLEVGSTRIIGGDNYDTQNTQRAKNKAVFASADVPLGARLSVVGGVRYTRSERSYSGCTKDIGDGSAAAAFNAAIGTNVQPGGCLTIQADLQPGLFIRDLDQDNVSWRGGLNYKPSRNVLLYGNVSRGFKAGGFQSLAAGTYTSLQPVVQEQLTAYEAGFKLGLFDRRLQLNGAAFYYDYIDKQIRSIALDPVTGNSEALVNVPKSRIAGFELSAAVRPVTGLSISSSITLVESKVLGSFIGITPTSVVIDLKDQAFPYTPKWSGNADAEYRWAVERGLKAVLGATVTYNSATYSGFGEIPTYRIRGYALLDLRAGIESEDGKWQLGVWGRNVTDEYYSSSVSRIADGGIRFAGMPATYGINLAYRY